MRDAALPVRPAPERIRVAIDQQHAGTGADEPGGGCAADDTTPPAMTA